MYLSFSSVTRFYKSYQYCRSDWTLDVTHPAVDAEEGWQYAHSFDETDDKWTAEMPAQLERLLTSNALVSAGLSGPSNLGNTMSSYSNRRHPVWVRRRRWVRIMRRRLDIPPLPFLELDGAMYHLNFDGTLIPYQEDTFNAPDDAEGQELTTIPSTSRSQDYVARARYLVGNQSQDSDSNASSPSALEVRRTVAKLERAVSELREGLLGEFAVIFRWFSSVMFLQEMTTPIEKYKLKFCSTHTVGS